MSRMLVMLILALSVGTVQTAPAVSDVKVKDHPNDAGTALDVSWRPPDIDPAKLLRFDVTATSDDGKPKTVEVGPTGSRVTLDELKPGTPYRVRVAAVGADGTSALPVEAAGPIAPQRQWLNASRAWLAILLGGVSAAVLGFIAAARRGIRLWVRPIAGLEAVTDAVGRAVEMGKNVLFVPGIQDINDIQTVAGVTVLSRVARIAAEYDAEIKVPTARSLVMATCRETVQASFLQAGRPDAYNADDIYYLTDEQFGYVAGVTGQMVRERPAACFYLGAFYAESLIFAETGNSIGSIQIAGTAEPTQLPFFIAACDYTLIGEEFFAASAYLSGEPQQLGSLKGQDVGKLLAAGLISAGVLLTTAVAFTKPPVERSSVSSVVDYLRDNVLGDQGLVPERAE